MKGCSRYKSELKKKNPLSFVYNINVRRNTEKCNVEVTPVEATQVVSGMVSVAHGVTLRVPDLFSFQKKDSGDLTGDCIV